MARLAAFIVMLIPGLMAAGGIKFMRDTLFGKLISPFPFLWLQFVVGVIFFVIGFGFSLDFYCIAIEKWKSSTTLPKNKRLSK